MKTIAIFYEHVNREFDTCRSIKKEIERRSDYKVFILSYQFQIFKALLLSNKRNFDVVIIPYAYKESSILPIAPLLRKSPIPYLINLHHEQIGAEFNEFRLLPISHETKHRIIHCVWSNSFKNKLLKLGISKDLIHVTGNMRADIPKTKNHYSREIFSKKFGLDITKKWILLSESGTQIFSPKEIEAKVMRGYKKEDILLRNIEIKKAINKTKNNLNNLGIQFLEKYELIYRAHPGTTIDGIINKKIKVIDKYSINDWLNVIDMNISRLSTTLFESEKSNVPSLRYDPTNFPKRILTFGLDEYRKIKDLNEIDNKIFDLAKNDLKNKYIYIKYLGVSDGNSVKRVANIVIDLIENGNENYDRSAIKINNRKFILKKLVSNFFSFIIVKNELNFFNRYSKSVTIFKNDIPPAWFKQKK